MTDYRGKEALIEYSGYTLIIAAMWLLFGIGTAWGFLPLGLATISTTYVMLNNLPVDEDEDTDG